MKLILFRGKTKPVESAVLQFISYCEPPWDSIHVINNVLKLHALISVMLCFVLGAVPRENV